MIDAVFIIFVFVAGACIGSFLNVVVWRLPRNESLISPPSHCPKCLHHLAWYDNIPVLGWLMLRGKCRYCGLPISPRYPIIEAVTGLLFVFYYVMFFMVHLGPAAPMPLPAGDPMTALLAGQPTDAAWIDRLPSTIVADWPTYGLYMVLVAGLLAASLIDAELFLIPLEIPWTLAVIGLVGHSILDRPILPGAVNLVDIGGAPAMAPTALAAGAALGLLISVAAWLVGWIPGSFAHGEPALEVDRDAYQAEVAQAKAEGLETPAEPVVMTPAQVRTEIRKEILFLLPPLVVGLLWLVLTWRVESVRETWRVLMRPDWVNALLGSLLGAMMGAMVVWLARIFGTLAFGRVAMGLGDVHLMFGVGAILGAGPAVLTFFLAPFAGIAIGLYLWLVRNRRELPFGPYLSVAAGAVMLCYVPVANYLRPGFLGLMAIIRHWMGIAG